MKKPTQPKAGLLSSLIKDKKTYGIAHKEVVFPEDKPKTKKKRSKVDKVVAKSLKLKRAHQKHVNVSPAQMDVLCARVRKLMLGAFVAGMVAASMCCWLVNANSLHKAYEHGYTAGKGSRVITYIAGNTP
jgi:hypothetical protein